MCSPTINRTQAEPVPLERLEGEICRLAAHVNAATCRWLELVGEFDRREGWAVWGAKSCSQWLGHRCGLSPAAARDHVRVARLIAELAGDPGGIRPRRALLLAGPGHLAGGHPGDRGRPAEHRPPRHGGAAGDHRARLSRRAGPRARRHAIRPTGADGSAAITTTTARSCSPHGCPPRRARWCSPRCRPAATSCAHGGGASAETTHIGDSDAERAPGEREAVSNADALLLVADSFLAAGGGSRALAERSATRSWCTSTRRRWPAPPERTHRPAHACCTRVRRSIPRPPAVWPATRAWSASSSATVDRCRSAAAAAASRPASGGPCAAATAPAAFPAAGRGASCTRTTSSTGPGEAAPICPTWSTSAASTTTWCTRAATRSSAALEASCASAAPTASRSSAAHGGPAEIGSALERGHRRAGLRVDERTCVPHVGYERLQPAWVVDGLVERDPRLRE